MFSKLLLTRIAVASVGFVDHLSTHRFPVLPGCKEINTARMQFKIMLPWLSTYLDDEVEDSLLLDAEESQSLPSFASARRKLKHFGHFFHFKYLVSSGNENNECTFLFPAHFQPHLVAQLQGCPFVSFCFWTMELIMLATYPRLSVIGSTSFGWFNFPKPSVRLKAADLSREACLLRLVWDQVEVSSVLACIAKEILPNM